MKLLMYEFRNILFSSLIILLLIGCGSRNFIKGYIVTQTFPLVNNNGKLLQTDVDTMYIFYYENKIIRKSPYLLIDTSFGISGNRYYDFVYSRNDSVGKLFDETREINGLKIKTDSILSGDILGGMNFYSNFSKFDIKHLKREFNQNSFLTDIYQISDPVSKDSIINLNLIYTFSKERPPHSIFPEMDTIKNMFLTKIKILNYAHVYYGITVDEVKEEFTTKQISNFNKEELMKTFSSIDP